MIVPVLILAVALLAAVVTAFGTDPGWGQFSHGLQLIMLSRRLEWPLVALALIACLAVIAMIVGGRWRAWWLLGLAPVLTVFAHRLSADPTRAMQITDEAIFVSAEQATFVNDEDYVVGLEYDGEAYAYPYSVLYQSPVVIQAQREQRLMLIWSAFANRAVATVVDRTVKPRELEIVSVPANALLVYNSRLGQFINGITGLTMEGHRPAGFDATVSTAKMPWKTWRAMHPRTHVMQPTVGWTPNLPGRPVLPHYPMPKFNGPPLPAGTRVALVATTRPVVVDEASIGPRPMNLLVGSDPLLMIRDGHGQIKAFLRQANGDLTPRFVLAGATHPPGAALTEPDSGSSWTLDGRAIAGPLKGEKLRPIDVDDDVYLDVIRFWYPDLTTITPKETGDGNDKATLAAAASPVVDRAHAARHRRTIAVKRAS